MASNYKLYLKVPLQDVFAQFLIYDVKNSVN